MVAEAKLEFSSIKQKDIGKCILLLSAPNTSCQCQQNNEDILKIQKCSKSTLMPSNTIYTPIARERRCCESRCQICLRETECCTSATPDAAWLIVALLWRDRRGRGGGRETDANEETLEWENERCSCQKAVDAVLPFSLSLFLSLCQRVCQWFGDQFYSSLLAAAPTPVPVQLSFQLNAGSHISAPSPDPC